MTTAFQELAAALRERLEVIADPDLRKRPAEHTERLKAVSGRIMDIQERLPEKMDPQLRHFLDRCSYDKALAFLESAPAGR